MVKLVTRRDQEWERIVFAEVVIPETVNVYGDYMSKSQVREFAYTFMRQGFGIDLEHDNVDISDKVKVVESFIVRPGDPDFTEGSWVVAMYVGDDDIWQDILDNEINGFSYEALMQFFSAVLEEYDDFTRSGITEPDPEDGHVHDFFVMVDEDNRPVSGGTSATDGHSHTISTHTITDESAGHSHRYNLVRKENS